MKFRIAEDVWISKDNVVRETPKAIFISNGSFKFWLPKSIITKEEDFKYFVPEWFMKQIQAEEQKNRTAWERHGGK
jgi:hypothetical protein